MICVHIKCRHANRLKPRKWIYLNKAHIIPYLVFFGLASLVVLNCIFGLAKLGKLLKNIVSLLAIHINIDLGCLHRELQFYLPLLSFLQTF